MKYAVSTEALQFIVSEAAAGRIPSDFPTHFETSEFDPFEFDITAMEKMTGLGSRRLRQLADEMTQLGLSEKRGRDWFFAAGAADYIARRPDGRGGAKQAAEKLEALQRQILSGEFK